MIKGKSCPPQTRTGLWAKSINQGNNEATTQSRISKKGSTQQCSTNSMISPVKETTAFHHHSVAFGLESKCPREWGKGPHCSSSLVAVFDFNHDCTRLNLASQWFACCCQEDCHGSFRFGWLFIKRFWFLLVRKKMTPSRKSSKTHKKTIHNQWWDCRESKECETLVHFVDLVENFWMVTSRFLS